MNKYMNLRLSIFWCLFAVTIIACDRSDNVEDPDLNYFIKYYGGIGNQYGVDMQALGDGSFLLLGNYSADAFTDIYLVHVDAQGDVLNETKFGGKDKNNILNARDLERTSDGGFVVLADFKTDVGTRTDLAVYKITADGTPVDSAFIGTEASDYGQSITLLDDGGFIVSGRTDSTKQWTTTDPGLDPGDTFAYRLDQNLDKVPGWGPVVHGFGVEGEVPLDVAVKTMQNGSTFYVFGHTNSDLNDNNPEGKLGFFYFERQSSGTIGRNYYPGNVVTADDTEIHFVDKVPGEMGGGFVLIGTSSTNVGISQIFLARLRSSLTFQSLQDDAMLYNSVSLQRNIRGVAATASIVGSYGYLILGDEVRSSTKTNFWLSKVDQGGNVVWSTTFGSEAEDDSGAAVTELPDGKIVVLGTMGLADNQFKMALIKMNPRGELLK